ncbi:MAG: 4-(cytidine 5'-diphospho)-2-C-methyl-D-erythritol kinase [Balneolaceae bacterium]
MWIAESYAKINLGLFVLERLPTGFHNIETGFCFIEWKDRFEVVESDAFSLSLTDPAIPSDDGNLVTRAYAAFEKYIGLKKNYAIRITKNIPAGAGLGGGSSNAALTLRLLNKLEGTGLSTDDLVDLSRNLGADIAFFIKGKPALGRGLGQDIEPLDIQPDSWIVTIYPGFESAASEAYRDCSPNPQPDFSLRNVLAEAPLEEWRYLLQNDLEPPVIARYELIGNIKDQLYEFGADYASMSGSGSAVYGLFEQDFVAVSAYEGFQDLGFRTNITRPAFKPDNGIYLNE